MRRAKLAPGSVPAGSLPTVHNQSVPLCFVCDEPIKSHRLSTSLLSGRTQYTHSPLPTKIGGYIGDEFVVVVTPQDTLCKHCTALINTMDRLELELRQHRFQLIQHLKTKYKLDGHCPKPANKVKTVEDKNRIYDTEIVEVSDEEWIPQKRQRTDAIKHHHCTVCNASFTNLNLFMAHLSRHKQSEKMKPATLSVLSTVKSSLSSVSESSQAPHFKCGCCSESFSSKETLAFHMHKHTSLSTKSKTISAAPELVDNSPSKTISSSQNSVLASTVPIFPQFDDAEQSCRQGVLAPNPTGVCSEEQKGRVCLLALLNNGVCSDISHCVGVPTPDSSNIVNAAQKTEEFCDGQTISITVSIPSIVNGGHVSEKRLSVPAILNSSHLSNVSYPVSLGSSSMHSASSLNPPSNVCQLVLKDTIVNTDKPLSQGLSSGEHSDASTSCLDMPDLSDDSVQNVAEKNVSNAQNCVEHSEDKADSSKDSSCFWLGNNPIGNLVPESALGLSILPPCRPSHGLDMPSLIDEDLIENDDKNMSIDQISETCGAVAETSGNSVQLNMGPAIEAVRNLQDEANIKFHSVTSSVSKSSSSNSFNSNKNIAIVSVTSVPRNIVGGHYIAGSLSNEWFCSSGMEISTVSAGSNVSKEIALSSSEWVEEDGSFHGKESQSDHNNACEYLTNDFSSVSKTLNVEESKSTVGQGARSKITSLV